jgi:pimeloyl-ACP methyl ester carboxylesterase
VLPHTQHTTFADTGHLPHRQQADAVIERVSRFLANGSKLADPKETGGHSL